MLRFVESLIDRGIALALPALVVLSCLLPWAALVLNTVPSWLVAVLFAVAAIGVCSFLLRDRGTARAVALSTFGVAAGAAVFVASMWGVNALGTSQTPVLNDLANSILGAMPPLLTVLALLAIAIGFRALPSDRLALGTAWALAFATPFALSVPIGALSDQAGNAGMDVIALFVMPLGAFLIWTFILSGTLYLQRDVAGRSDAP